MSTMEPARQVVVSVSGGGRRTRKHIEASAVPELEVHGGVGEVVEDEVVAVDLLLPD